VDRVIQLLDGARADVRHLGPSAEFQGVPTVSSGSPTLSTRRRLRACGWRAGQECVVMYPMTVAASGLSAYRSESGSSSVARHRWYFGS
jgi:hypothetical protein